MKWITVQGRDREGKGLHYLIHGAYDVQEGDRVLVFPSSDRRLPYAAAKGLPIGPGSRVVAIPHSKMPWSRITTSIFENDSLPPTANFEVDGTYGYQPFEVGFTDLSYANPPVMAWHWDFGDGTTSTEQHPTHTYQGLGWFTVTLTVSNGLGEDTIRKESLIFSEVDHPIDLEAWRNSPTSAQIYWEPGANNTHVVITRRPDFSPPHPNNGTMIYHGAAGPGSITDSGLQAGREYYYRVWGIRNGVRSDGYRSAMIATDPSFTTLFVGGYVSMSPIPTQYYELYIGSITFFWSGAGRLILSGSGSSSTAGIPMDNMILVKGPWGTYLGPQAAPSYVTPAVDITHLCGIGTNTIHVYAKDSVSEDWWCTDNNATSGGPVYLWNVK